MVSRLLQVLLQSLPVGLLLGERDVGGQIRLELSLFGIGLVEPLDELCIAFVQISHLAAPCLGVCLAELPMCARRMHRPRRFAPITTLRSINGLTLSPLRVAPECGASCYYDSPAA